MKWGDKSEIPASRSIVLTDEMPFPFGKHGPKGTEPCSMKQVPSAYLDWLLGQEWIGEWPAVVAYIEKNKSSIDQDLKHSQREHRRYVQARDEGYQEDGDDVPF